MRRLLPLMLSSAVSACGGGGTHLRRDGSTAEVSDPADTVVIPGWVSTPEAQPSQVQQVTNTEAKLPSAKVTFRLVQDADGYPPVNYESMWARRLPDGTYEIDNIPFYSYEVAAGDVVRVEEVNGELFFKERVKTPATA